MHPQLIYYGGKFHFPEENRFIADFAPGNRLRSRQNPEKGAAAGEGLPRPPGRFLRAQKNLPLIFGPVH